jgi:2'-5' RNA ligase
MIRAFLAVELDESLRAAIEQVQRELRDRIDRQLRRDTRIRWVRPESIHVTVKFLGDIEEALVDRIGQALGPALAGTSRFTVPVGGVGVFPNRNGPRVLWIGCAGGAEQSEEVGRWRRLHQAVERTLEPLGFAAEAKPFSPHLTLARIKDGERLVGRILTQSGVFEHPLSCGILDVGAISLMRSELKPAGAEYRRLWQVKLQHAADA